MKTLRLALLLLILGVVFTEKSASAGNTIPILGLSQSPLGQKDFCRRWPEDCQRQLSTKRPHLSLELYLELLKINTLVNRDIWEIKDPIYYGLAEFWSYPDNGYGDCEDYALEKRRRLIKSGWSPDSLVLAVVLTAKGEGHGVLVAKVQTSNGPLDLILDNLTNQLVSWDLYPYLFVSVQSGTDPRQWYSGPEGYN